MPVALAVLRSFLVTVALALVQPLLSRIISALGFGVLSYVGAGALLDTIKGKVLSSLGGLPSDAVQIISMCGVGVALQIMVSALSIRATLSGLDSAGNFVVSRWKASR